VSRPPFADRLFERVERIGSRLVIGLDPDLARIPAAAQCAVAEETLVAFAAGILDAAGDLAAAVKPQAAFYERHGWRGWRALERTCAHAAARGIPVILDAKRGDIGSTAAAYAEALLGDAPGTLGAAVDALTVNPYLGEDSLAPFLERARTAGRGLFVLARTSNPGGAQFQGHGPPDRPLFLEVARAAARWGAGTEGACGYAAVGLVAGATFPAELAAIRAAAPRAPLLIPGVGAQGGDPADLVAAFDPRGFGAVVNSSRAVIFAAEGRPDVEWQEAVRDAALATRDGIERVLRRG
jgi:orotidine-5'-phosphate decarboxylase